MQAGGVLLTLLKSLYHDIVAVFQPPSIPLSADSFNDILRYGACTGCVIPPYLLEEMLADPRYFDTLAGLDFVQFGSGPLSLSAGNTLLTRQKNCPHFIGSSECGLFILLELDDSTADWQYFRFHPWSGVDMRPIDDEHSIHELVIVRLDAPVIPGMQPVFELFPDLKEWSTNDLYVRHPSKADHWRCIGRNDDVIVLSNGEKLNPADTEGRIVGVHPSVTGVLVIGQGRFAPGLLLEVKDVGVSDAVQRAQLIAEIWPMIQATNQVAPGHGQLNKDLILLTTPEKPFLRTPKLSIRRKPTVDMYEDEIEKMYEQYKEVTEDSASEEFGLIDLSSTTTIESFLIHRISAETGWTSQLRAGDDLFALGMDSLQVLRITRAVKTTLAGRGVHGEFNTRLFYRNPTIKSLSEAILNLANARTNLDNNSGHVPNETETIEALIQRYSRFDAFASHTETMLNQNVIGQQQCLNIILTGSTGSLGSFLLLALLAKPTVAKVYCLNRSQDAKERQIRLFKSYGIDSSRLLGFETRVEFFHSASLDAPQLGLSRQGSFDTLKEGAITHIIHNAWPVNFNMALASFESHIAGVRALIDFAAMVPEHPKFVFVSSLSSVSSLAARMTVPECMVRDATAPSPMGYGQSKYVAEQVLNNATEALDGTISTVILRIGQIAGPVLDVRAAWPEREWLPSLVISSKTLQALPSSLGHMGMIDWVPVDMLANGIGELLDVEPSRHRDDYGNIKKQAAVFHVVNPTAVTWADLLEPLKSAIGVSRTVPLGVWIDLVRQGPEEDCSVQRNPAKRILSFYEALANHSRDDEATNETADTRENRKRFTTGGMYQCSETFRNMPPVSREWLARWADQWS